VAHYAYSYGVNADYEIESQGYGLPLASTTMSTRLSVTDAATSTRRTAPVPIRRQYRMGGTAYLRDTSQTSIGLVNNDEPINGGVYTIM
jgi:hypothetical protein